MADLMRDVNTHVLESVHFLYWGPIHFNKVVHYQILCLVDVLDEVVLFAPVLQSLNLF